MNSVIQSLANSEIIVKLLLGEKNDKVKFPSITLVDELRFLMRVLRSGEY